MSFFPILSGLLGGGGSLQILGTPLGTAGSGINTGMTLVGGLDFASSSIANAIATPQNPKAPLWPTRGYSGGGGMRSPATTALAVMTDASADYTGWADFSRGIRPTYDNGAPQQILPLTDAAGPGGTRNALRLHACRQSTAEQVFLASGVAGQIERGSIAHTLTSLWWCAPAKINVRASIPTGPRGWHPTLWSVQIPGNGYCYNGSEHGFECNGLTTTNAYEDPHTNGSPGANVGTLDLGTTYRTTAPHDWCIDESFTSAGKLTYYLDGTQVNQLTASQTVAGANPSYALWTSHVYNSTFGGEAYVAGDWATAGAGGANLDIFGIQVWVPTGGKLYTPLVTISDVLCTAGQAISFTLPSTLSLWGVASVTDQTFCMPTEIEEPGNTNTGWTGAAAGAGMPLWLSYNAGTRTYSGTVPAQGGTLNMVCGYCPPGNALVPATFRIVVAPVYVGATTLALTNGVASTTDLFVAWDIGRDFVSGATTAQGAKAITATGLPTGLSLGTDGKLVGTTTVNGSYTIVTTARNNDGQTTSQNIAVTVSAASSAVPAPTFTAGTVVGYWDANDASKITSTGGVVTAFAPTIGTVTLANASTGPTVVTRVDGNGNTKTALLFHANQFLTAATSLGITSDMTMIAVVEWVQNSITQVVCDLSAGASSFTTNRHIMVSSSTAASGLTYRKNDGSAVQSTAGSGSFPTVGAGKLHLYIGRSPSGSSATILDVGTGTDITGTPVSTAGFAVNTLTVGASTETSAKAKFGEFYLSALIIVQNVIAPADIPTTQAWGTTNYGIQTN